MLALDPLKFFMLPKPVAQAETLLVNALAFVKSTVPSAFPLLYIEPYVFSPRIIVAMYERFLVSVPITMSLYVLLVE